MSSSDEDIQSDNESHYSDEESDDETIVLCDKCGDTFPPNMDPRALSFEDLQQLRSGIPLDNTRIKETMRLERHSKNRKTRLESEIARHYEIIRKLSREKDKAELENSWQNSLLAPIRRLPNDILDEIMILVWDESWFPRELYKDKEIVRSREKSRCALILSHVCHYWRQATVANKKLWSSISNEKISSRPYSRRCGADEHMVGNVPCHLADKWLQLSLERSGSYPLEVDYYFGPTSSYRPRPPYELLMNIHRWGSLSIEHDRLKDIPTDAELSSLERLFVRGIQDHRSKEDWPIPVGRAPRLHTAISIHSVAAVAFPWSQLTSLSLYKNRDAPEALLGPLSQCLQLAKLYLRLEIDELPPDKLQPVTLPKLHELKLHYSYIGRAQGLYLNICRLLVLPSLKTLVLDSDQTLGIVYNCKHVLDLLERSRCRLISLRLWNTRCLEAQQLVDLLGTMPELQVLELLQQGEYNEDPVNEATLKHLIPTFITGIPSRMLLPDLRTLSVRGAFNFDSSGELISSILDTRTRQYLSSASQLRSLSVHINQTTDDESFTGASGSSKEALRRRTEQLAKKIESYKAAVEPYKGRGVTIQIQDS